MTDGMTPRLANLYALALAMNLSEPLGRAVYACNRRYNGGFSRMSDEHILQVAKESTAVRWREHWDNGGTLKSLSANHRRKGFVPQPPVVLSPYRRSISFNKI